MASQLFGQFGGVLHVRLYGAQARVGGEFFRVAHQRGDLMSALQRFLQQGGADITSGADQSDLHGGDLE